MAYKVRMGSGRVEVSTLAEASREFRAWIERLGFGASDLQRNDGLIYEDKDRAAKYRVSYNGRLWDMNDRPLVEMSDGAVVDAKSCTRCWSVYVPVASNHTHDGKCPQCVSAEVES